MISCCVLFIPMVCVVAAVTPCRLTRPHMTGAEPPSMITAVECAAIGSTCSPTPYGQGRIMIV